MIAFAKVFTGELNLLKAHKNPPHFSGSDVALTFKLTVLSSPLGPQWDEVSGLDEENNSVRIYQILSCQTGSSTSHWLRSGFIQRQGASQVYVELRFTMMECSSSTHHRSCKETFTLFYYQTDSDDATSGYPPWMENPYIKVALAYFSKSSKSCNWGLLRKWLLQRPCFMNRIMLKVSRGRGM